MNRLEKTLMNYIILLEREYDKLVDSIPSIREEAYLQGQQEAEQNREEIDHHQQGDAGMEMHLL